MWPLFQSADVVLNLAWLSLCLTTVLAWCVFSRAREHQQAVVAILCMLVLLFPVISAADDVAEQAVIYDLSPSSLTVNNSKQIKQLVGPVLPAARAGHGLAHPLREAVGESVQADSAVPGILLLPSFSSGIHSPPQF